MDSDIEEKFMSPEQSLRKKELEFVEFKQIHSDLIKQITKPQDIQAMLIETSKQFKSTDGSTPINR